MAQKQHYEYYNYQKFCSKHIRKLVKITQIKYIVTYKLIVINWAVVQLKRHMYTTNPGAASCTTLEQATGGRGRRFLRSAPLRFTNGTWGPSDYRCLQ